MTANSLNYEITYDRIIIKLQDHDFECEIAKLLRRVDEHPIWSRVYIGPLGVQSLDIGNGQLTLYLVKL